MAENVIPMNADKLLFAHDLVNYVFRIKPGVHVYNVLEDYRNIVFEGFTNTVKGAVGFLEDVLYRETDIFFRGYVEGQHMSTDLFFAHTKSLEERIFNEGFEPENFLAFCVHVSLLAMFCYDHGATNAPQMAVDAIIECFKEYDMFHGGWDCLKAAAEEIQRASFASPSPPPSPPQRQSPPQQQPPPPRQQPVYP